MSGDHVVFKLQRLLNGRSTCTCLSDNNRLFYTVVAVGSRIRLTVPSVTRQHHTNHDIISIARIMSFVNEWA